MKYSPTEKHTPLFHDDIDYRTMFIAAFASMLIHVGVFAIIIYGSPLLDTPGQISAMNISLDAFDIEGSYGAATPVEPLDDVRHTYNDPIDEQPVEPAWTSEHQEPDILTDDSGSEEVVEPDPIETFSVQEPTEVPATEVPVKEPPKPQPAVQKQPKLIKPKATKPAVIPQEDPDKIRAARIAQAIAKITKDVEKQGSGAGTASSGTGASSSGGTIKGGTDAVNLLEAYKSRVADIIRQNWAYLEPLSGGKTNMEAILTFRILPSGQISNLRIARSSGNPYLDQSAMDAVRRSNPVIPHPAPLKEPYIEISLLCGPEGMK